MFRQLCLSGLHGSARNKNTGYVETHSGVEHARCDFIAVGNTDHGIGAVGIDHVFHRVGNNVSRGQAIEHAVVTHSDPVVDRDGVELFSNASGGFDFSGDQLTHIF